MLTEDQIQMQEASYWQWLKKAAPSSDRLKWCHRTDAFALRSIIKNGSVSPHMCSVFQEPLIYLFYGRPAYRSNESQQLRLSAKAPVIIIFNNNIEKSGTRIFPFDSGAFDSRYDPWRHQDMKLSEFCMPCGNDAAERHVAEFFGDRKRYLSMEPIRPNRSYAGEFEVEAIAEILNDRSFAPADDRRLAVELQVDRKLLLQSDEAFALVIPESISEAEWFTKWLEGQGAGIVIKTYQLRPLHTAGHYQAALEDICAELV